MLDKYKLVRFFKVEAACKALSTKKDIVFFQDRGRPQGGINEKDNRSFTKSPHPKMGGGKNRSDSLLQWKQARKNRANVVIDIPKRFKQVKTSIRQMNKFTKIVKEKMVGTFKEFLGIEAGLNASTLERNCMVLKSMQTCEFSTRLQICNSFFL